uniref:Protein atonal homolog 8 n=1 Tax=Sphenodon punctatus TaxID=8508 RepID=A0A8D0L3P1_SPHPU
MRNMQLLEEPGWKRLCSGKEIQNMKRLKRRGRDPHRTEDLVLGGQEGVIDLRKGPPHPQAFPDQSLPARILLGQGQQRPLESAFSLPHATYSQDPPASPRKLPGEPAAAAAGGVSSEIKAIQQTRRLLANARERTRVHTISAAFEALRKQVPCYSYGQKLSKLAILRIACNYILSLARLADMDYSADRSNLSFSECVEQCTRTLQAEGRSKKRKVCFR